MKQNHFVDAYDMVMVKCQDVAKKHLIKRYPDLAFKIKSQSMHGAYAECDAGVTSRYDASNGHWFEVYVSLESSKNFLKLGNYKVSVNEFKTYWEFGNI